MRSVTSGVARPVDQQGIIEQSFPKGAPKGRPCVLITRVVRQQEEGAEDSPERLLCFPQEGMSERDQQAMEQLV